MNRIIIAAAAILLCLTASAQTKDWARTDRYAEANAAITVRPKAVFMGDSITDRWGNSDDPEFFREHNFVGRGISGQTSCQMLVRFTPDVIDLHPKYAVILAGTNDLAHNIGEIDKDKILKNIQAMCTLAKANKIKPIVCSVLPAYQFGWRKELKPAQEIVELNAMLREYAKEAKIPYVDYYSAMVDERGGLPKKYSKDEVHPFIDGYKVMEEIILQYIK